MAPVTPKLTRSGSTQLSEIKHLITESEKSIRSDINDLRQQFMLLTSRFDEIQRSVKAIDQNQDKLKTQLSQAKSDTIGLIKETENFVLKEVENRISRMNNIIIRGLPETGGTLQARDSSDRQQTSKIFSELDFQNERILEIKRLGKSSRDGPRLLRISLPEASKAKAILRKARSLRNGDFRNVFIQADFTPYQQVKYRELRKQLIDRQEKGEDVVLYRDEIRLRSELQNFRR